MGHDKSTGCPATRDFLSGRKEESRPSDLGVKLANESQTSCFASPSPSPTTVCCWNRVNASSNDQSSWCDAMAAGDGAINLWALRSWGRSLGAMVMVADAGMR